MPRKTDVARRKRHGTVSFNEAAARCHGKPRGRLAAIARPHCFNEAAARCHGKRWWPRLSARCWRRFNEAAARCHGKRKAMRDLVRPESASMRPRPDATENAHPLVDR